MNFTKTKTLFYCSFFISIICSSCEVECTSRIDNMKIFSAVSDTTTEVTSYFPGWYHSEFQKDKLHFTLEFDHFSGSGGGKCNWVWVNYPLENSIELFCNKTLHTDTDTVFQLESLLDHFNIEKYETENKYITFLLSQKPEVNFLYKREYYKFTARILTDDDLDMEDSCVVKIVD